MLNFVSEQLIAGNHWLRKVFTHCQFEGSCSVPG